MATNTNKGKSNVIGEGDVCRLWAYADKVAPQMDNGKSWGLTLKADTVDALEALVVQVIAMGTVDHVLRNAAYTADDGSQVAARFEDGVQVTDRRHVFANGRTVQYDPNTGQAKCALFIVPRENGGERRPRRAQTNSSPRPVTTTTVDPAILAANPDITAAQAKAIAAILAGGK